LAVLCVYHVIKRCEIIFLDESKNNTDVFIVYLEFIVEFFVNLIPPNQGCAQQSVDFLYLSHFYCRRGGERRAVEAERERAVILFIAEKGKCLPLAALLEFEGARNSAPINRDKGLKMREKL